MFGPSLGSHQSAATLLDACLVSAADAAGCDDFGSDDFLEPLEVMLDDLLHRARLSGRGRLVTPYYLQRLLRLRLRVVDALKTQPTTLPRRPLFILGLPRTGSTLLHELLALHPELRAPTFWECHAMPRGGWRDTMTKALTRAQVLAVHLLAPNLKRIHPLAALGPHECVSLHALSFRSMQFHAAYRLPSYDSWMRGRFEWQPAYTWHRQHLALLGASDPQRRWVLKAPAHMLAIGALQASYPDARLIALHRDPLTVIPSMANLSLSLRNMTSRIHDPHEIGADVSQLWHKGLDCFLAARNADPALDRRVLDLPYRFLTREPEQALAAICDFAGVAWSETYAARVRAHLTANPQHRHGVHRYTLAQFGLKEEEMKKSFAAYRERFRAL